MKLVLVLLCVIYVSRFGYVVLLPERVTVVDVVDTYMHIIYLYFVLAVRLRSPINARIWLVVMSIPPRIRG